MKKGLKILLITVAVILLLIGLAPVVLYFVLGINYFAIDKTYSKNEIIESANSYSNQGVFLIKESFFDEYGKGHFPKYKIYNPAGIMLKIHPCYESLPILPAIIKLKESDSVQSEKFENEISKIRNANNDSTSAGNAFALGKYNMIFYYKNAMDRIQKRQLDRILKHDLGDFSDSLNVVFVNVDKVDF